MALSVTDAAELLSVLVAADPADPASPGKDEISERYGVASFASYADPAGLNGARIGVWRAGSAAAGPATTAVLDQAVQLLSAAGATVVDPVEVPQVDEIEELSFTALLHEFKHDLGGYLRELPGSHPVTLAELIEFNERNAASVLKYFGQDIFELAQAKSADPDDPEWVQARQNATKLARAAIDGPLAAQRLDAIVALSLNPAHLTDMVLGDHNVFQTSTPAAAAGYPSVSVPAGEVSGLPVGLSFIGTRWSEPKLIALAYAFEQAVAGRGRG
jgi:amidase